MHYLSETQRMVRLPNNKSQEFGKIKKFNDSFYKKNGFLPTGDVICNALELSEISYSKIMEFSTDFKSLTQTLDSGSGEEFCLEDLVESNFFDAPDKQSNVSDMKIGVKYLMSLLNNREIDVIKADFEFLDEQGNIEITRDQINEKYGLTETRINQIKQQALAKIRSKFGIKKFKMLLA